MAIAEAQKTSWADDVDEPDSDFQKPDYSVDENGIVTIVQIYENDEGKKIKSTRRVKRTLKKAVVEPVVAQRKLWSKFGQEKGNKPGPDRATTTVAEDVALKLSAGNKSQEQEPSVEQAMKAKLNKAGAGKVLCRLCKGDHFTAKCPYKDTLAGLDAPGLSGIDTPPAEDDFGTKEPSAPAAPAAGGKYVPPSMRAGAGARMGERPGGNRDDLPTLRVTNVSEDTTDQDLRDLFGVIGRVARVFIGRDRETGVGKGYAFVSFEDRATAARALERVNGMGYDNLILNCQWSQPREQR